MGELKLLAGVLAALVAVIGTVGAIAKKYKLALPRRYGWLVWLVLGVLIVILVWILFLMVFLVISEVSLRRDRSKVELIRPEPAGCLSCRRSQWPAETA